MKEPTEKKYFALLANDFHAGRHNLREFEKNWDEMIAVAERYGIKLIVIGGDMYESRAGQTLDVLMAVRRAFDRTRDHGIRVIVADGNHDKINGDSTFSYNNIFAGCNDGMAFIDTYTHLNVPDSDVVLWVMSYFNEKGRFMEVYAKMVDSLGRHPFNEKYNILYCHQGISGGLAGISDKELDPEIFEPFDRVLVGHYHNRRDIPDTEISYIGASRQHNFGEDIEKGYTLLTTDGYTEFALNCANHRYVTFNVVFNELDAVLSDIKEAGETCPVPYSIRLVLSCTEAEAKKIDRDALRDAGVVKLELATEQEVRHARQADFRTKYTKDGIKSEYKGYCESQDLTADEMALGLRYLDKIDESCGN